MILRYYDSVIFTVTCDVGVAADDVKWKVMEAKDNTGTDKRVVHVRRFYRKQAVTISSAGAFSEVAPTNAHDVLLEGANENILLVEVHSSELDYAGGFEFLAMQHDGGGAAGKLATVTAQFVGPRYTVEPATWAAVDA